MNSIRSKLDVQAKSCDADVDRAENYSKQEARIIWLGRIGKATGSKSSAILSWEAYKGVRDKNNIMFVSGKISELESYRMIRSNGAVPIRDHGGDESGTDSVMRSALYKITSDIGQKGLSSTGCCPLFSWVGIRRSVYFTYLRKIEACCPKYFKFKIESSYRLALMTGGLCDDCVELYDYVKSIRNYEKEEQWKKVKVHYNRLECEHSHWSAAMLELREDYAKTESRSLGWMRLRHEMETCIICDFSARWVRHKLSAIAERNRCCSRFLWIETEIVDNSIEVVRVNMERGSGVEKLIQDNVDISLKIDKICLRCRQKIDIVRSLKGDDMKKLCGGDAMSLAHSRNAMKPVG